MIKESKNKRRIYYEEKNYKHAACSGNDHYYAVRMWKSVVRYRKYIYWCICIGHVS